MASMWANLLVLEQNINNQIETLQQTAGVTPQPSSFTGFKQPSIYEYFLIMQWDIMTAINQLNQLAGIAPIVSFAPISGVGNLEWEYFNIVNNNIQTAIQTLDTYFGIDYVSTLFDSASAN